MLPLLVRPEGSLEEDRDDPYRLLDEFGLAHAAFEELERGRHVGSVKAREGAVGVLWRLDNVRGNTRRSKILEGGR